jgi:NAD(P)-dependent dehydrogenase (short-subunit alcohol dehydrogenase family)
MNRRWIVGAAVAGAGAWAAGRALRQDAIAGDVALVTGGSRGLGFLIAERLLRQGCRVAICGRDADTLERARVRLQHVTGGDIMTGVCDVADPDAVAQLVDDVRAHFGSLDIVVNNAGIIVVGPLDTLRIDDFRRAVDVNLMGFVHVTLTALPHMRARGYGRIANITSIGGKVAIPHLLPYDCAKFAAVGFSEGLRAEVARDGVRVTTIVPGLMRIGSPLHVEFRGQPAHEFAWFALGGLTPLSAMSAERAADRIVRAIRRGEAEVVLSWQAKLLRVLHDVSPAGVTRVLGGVNRLLPDNDGGTTPRTGLDLVHALPSVVKSTLERAGRRTNQLP